MRTDSFSLARFVASLALAAAASGCGSSGGSSGGDATLLPPGGVVATPRYGYVDLSWDAREGATGYVVYTASVPGAGPTNYWFVDGGEKRVVYGTQATFGEYAGASERFLRVAALAGTTEGVLSPTVSVTLPPDPPEFLLAEAGSGEVELRVGRSSGASVYEVFLASDESLTSANWASLPDGRREEVSLVHRVTGLVNGRAYWFVARAVNASGPSRDSVRAQATPSARGTFAPAGAFVVGLGPAGVAAADFDGDGRIDAATANAAEASVSVLRGDGAGGLVGRVDFAVGAGPTGIAAADVSGDGEVDLVTADADGGTVSVLLGDGTGGFLAAVAWPAGTRPVALAAADFDRDGRLDLAVADATAGRLRFLRGLGGGAFAAPVAFVVGAGPTSIVSGDFDGDGALDAALSSPTAGTVTAWFGDATGAFPRTTTLSAGLDCRSVSSGDFDGNGRRDLVALAAGDQVLTLFLSNDAGGFAPGIQMQTPGGDSTLVTSADLDGDFRPDLLLANAPTTSLSVMLSRPGTPFWHLADMTTTPVPTAVATADLNGDGVLDLLVTNSIPATLSVLLGRS
jgi:hypothetical protein